MSYRGVKECPHGGKCWPRPGNEICEGTCEKVREKLHQILTLQVRDFGWLFQRTDISREEAQQIWLEGALRASDTYDPNKGAFRRYCYAAIRGAIARNAMGLVRLPTHAALARLKDFDNCSDEIKNYPKSRSSVLVEDISSSNWKSDTEKKIIIKRIFALVNSFSAREGYIMTRYYTGEDTSLRVIGEEVGLSKERVRQILEDCITKIREKLNEKGGENEEA
jgi:RNA polymerase sigma factor (sigma-70 family)